MPDPIITTAILAQSCITGLVSGPISGKADRWTADKARLIGDILRRGTPRQNHHILRATQAAYVAAMRDMARACREQALGGEEVAAAKALVDLVGRKAFHEFRYDGEHFPLDEALAAVDRMFGGGIAVIDGGGEAAEHRAFGGAVVDDLAAWGVVLAPLQRRLFEEGLGSHAPWHLRFRIAFGEELIRDREALTIFTAERLGELRGQGIRLIDAVARLGDDVRDGFAASAARDAEIKAKLDMLMVRRGDEIVRAAISERAVVRIAGKVSEHVADADQALAEIERAIDDLLALRVDAARGSNLDALVDAALRRIDARAAAGEFDAAAQEAARAFAEWEGREEERRARERAIGLRFVEENIRTNRLRRDPAAVAAWLHRRLALEDFGGRPSREAINEAFEELVASGRDQGINFDLEVAAALAGLAERDATDEPARADAMTLRGMALQISGTRQEGTALLDEAIATLRAALAVFARIGRPFDRAVVETNLGNALGLLGAREDGTVALEEAVAVYRSALAVFSQDEAPRAWGIIQNNLGNSLLEIGKRQAGVVALDGSVAAYRAALTVRDRVRQPVAWSITQNNLGNALQELGRRQEGTAALEEAVAVYRLALEVRTRATLPVAWAMTQNNLGGALAVLGRRQDGTEALEGSVAAYRAALEVRVRDRHPVEWAITKGNLGMSLAERAERLGDADGLRESIAHLEAALDVLQRPGLGFYRAITEAGLARATRMLATLG